MGGDGDGGGDGGDDDGSEGTVEVCTGRTKNREKRTQVSIENIRTRSHHVL